jgi:hypothetical protein
MSTSQRLWLSALVAFSFNSIWSFFANSLVSEDMTILLRSALVQGFYSGIVTLLFTLALEMTYERVHTKYISFAFVVPLLCLAHHKTTHASVVRKAFNQTLNLSARWFDGICWPSALFAPLIPLSIQSALVAAVNLVNQTPNLVLTITPSILFSAIYGYTYTLTLLRNRTPVHHQADNGLVRSKQTNL